MTGARALSGSLLWLSALLLPGAVSGRDGGVEFGVTTHFSQGWPVAWMTRASTVGATSIRDSLHWPRIEQQRGQYTFTAANSGHVARACEAGMSVLLGIEPRNPLYDGGSTAYSPEARSAFARYVMAIADRYPNCVKAIEIGNEINGLGGMTGAAATARAASHTALLRSVYSLVKPAKPELQILGGSTNTIATGFLTRLMAEGALSVMDGIVVHPYRRDPEGVDWEIGRLQAAMAAAGTVKPVWATEFGGEFANPADAAPYLLKMTALMQSAGVRQHYWYALLDQKFFPTMGLLTWAGGEKPAARAFNFAAGRLGPLGPARREATGDATLFHFRFGDRVHVIWGGGRKLIAGGQARFFRSDGRTIADPGVVSDDPVVIFGADSVRFGPSEWQADSLYGFGQPPLHWFARRDATGQMIPLEPIDWQWTPYLGNRAVPAMVVNYDGIGPAAGTSAVVRYTASAQGSQVASFCLAPVGKGGDGVTVTLVHDSRTIWHGPVGPRSGRVASSVAVSLKSGDVIDLVVSPGGTAAADRLRYRFRIGLPGSEPANC